MYVQQVEGKGKAQFTLTPDYISDIWHVWNRVQGSRTQGHPSFKVWFSLVTFRNCYLVKMLGYKLFSLIWTIFWTNPLGLIVYRLTSSLDLVRAVKVSQTWAAKPRDVPSPPHL